MTVSLVKPAVSNSSEENNSNEHSTSEASYKTSRRSGYRWRSSSSWLEYFLGSFHYRRAIITGSTRDVSSKRSARKSKEELIVEFRTPAWLINKAWEARSIKACSGWTFHLRIHNILPYDSKAFEYARVGNVKGLQTLFERREASPFDRTEGGYTLLHVSFRRNYVNYACAFAILTSEVRC